MTNATTNKIHNNVWKTVSIKSQRIRKTNLVNETEHLEIPLNNVHDRCRFPQREFE